MSRHVDHFVQRSYSFYKCHGLTSENIGIFGHVIHSITCKNSRKRLFFSLIFHEICSFVMDCTFKRTGQETGAEWTLEICLELRQDRIPGT